MLGAMCELRGCRLNFNRMQNDFGTDPQAFAFLLTAGLKFIAIPAAIWFEILKSQSVYQKPLIPIFMLT